MKKQLAHDFGVKPKDIDRAKRLQSRSPHLFQAAFMGLLSLDQAELVLKQCKGK